MAEPGDNGARASILRRLDFLPAWVATSLGIALGAAAGVLLIQAHPVGGVVAFVALLVLAGALAWSGEPVAIFDGVEPEPTAPEEPYVVRPGWVAIPGGTFMMGSPEGEDGHTDQEGPVHEVQLSPFEIMQYPVTRQTYTEVMGEDPGWPAGEAERRPVNYVSWLDAVEYCNRLSEKDGLGPCYLIQNGEVSWNRLADGYRLPTEAEWEHACRAGTMTRWSFGDDEDELDQYAWYDANSADEPHPVGEKEPNPWQIYDMHGNVFEWCWDRFGDYPEEQQVDPSGPFRVSSIRVLRGGSFLDAPGFLRSASRFRYEPKFRYWIIGFRCVRSSRRQLDV